LGFFSLEKRRLQGHLVAAFQHIKRLMRKMERDFLPRPVVTGQDNSFTLKKGSFRVDITKKFLQLWWQDTERDCQRSCGCPIMGSVQGQVEQGFGQCSLVKDVPVHGRENKLDDLVRSLPTQTIP